MWQRVFHPSAVCASVYFDLHSIGYIAEFLCVQGLHPCVFTHALRCTLRQMGVICHNGWASGWWSESVSRLNVDREPGPASTKTRSGEAGTASELTREMIEKAREVNWALWTSIIELKHWEEHEKIGWKRGRIARSDRVGKCAERRPEVQWE